MLCTSNRPASRHVWLFALGRVRLLVDITKALAERIRTAGETCEVVVVSAPPTGSIRRRTRVLIDTIEEHCSKGDGPIHLIGH